jgi:hypothetical protein
MGLPAAEGNEMDILGVYMDAMLAQGVSEMTVQSSVRKWAYRCDGALSAIAGFFKQLSARSA